MLKCTPKIENNTIYIDCYNHDENAKNLLFIA